MDNASVALAIGTRVHGLLGIAATDFSGTLSPGSSADQQARLRAKARSIDQRVRPDGYVLFGDSWRMEKQHLLDAPLELTVRSGFAGM